MSGRRTTALKAAQKAEALKSTDSKRATPRISFKNEILVPKKLFESKRGQKQGTT